MTQPVPPQPPLPHVPPEELLRLLQPQIDSLVQELKTTKLEWSKMAGLQASSASAQFFKFDPSMLKYDEKGLTLFGQEFKPFGVKIPSLSDIPKQRKEREAAAKQARAAEEAEAREAEQRRRADEAKRSQARREADERRREQADADYRRHLRAAEAASGEIREMLERQSVQLGDFLRELT